MIWIDECNKWSRVDCRYWGAGNFYVQKCETALISALHYVFTKFSPIDTTGPLFSRAFPQSPSCSLLESRPLLVRQTCLRSILLEGKRLLPDFRARRAPPGTDFVFCLSLVQETQGETEYDAVFLFVVKFRTVRWTASVTRTDIVAAIPEKLSCFYRCQYDFVARSPCGKTRAKRRRLRLRATATRNGWGTDGKRDRVHNIDIVVVLLLALSTRARLNRHHGSTCA